MLRITTSGDATKVLAVAGEVDLSTAEQLTGEITGALDAPGVELVKVDLGEVSFMDSAGLRVLVAGMKQAASRNIRLVAENPQPQVGKVLRITGLDEVLGLSTGDSAARD
jgi:anti-sigma B factor antagonist